MPNTRFGGDVQYVSPLRATGADLPEELFEDILAYVESPSWAEKVEDYPPSRSPVVHSLASFALVCKYFARVCRPKLYRRVSLRNRRQFKGLADFLDISDNAFGKPFLAFTTTLDLVTGQEDAFWVHQVATVLMPRMRHAGLEPFGSVNLKVDRSVPGIFSARAHLPRTLPSSLFQHISSLVLAKAHFKCGQDLIQSLSTFPNLHSTHLLECVCGTLEPRPTLCRLTLKETWARLKLVDSSTVVPIVVSEALDSWAAGEPMSIPAQDREDFKILTDVITLMSDRLVIPASKMYCDVLIRAGKCVSVYLGATQDGGSGGGKDQFYALHLYPQEKAQYAFTIFIVKLPTRGGIVDTKLSRAVWRELVGFISRLSHLNTFKVSFDTLYLMKAFMNIIHPVLRELHERGRKMKIGPAGGLVDVSVFLQRFMPEPESSMEEVREEDENGAEANLSAGTKREIPHEPLDYVIEFSNEDVDV